MSMLINIGFINRSPELSTGFWRFGGAGLLGYAALTGLQVVNNLPVKHNDEALLQQAYSREISSFK